MRNIWKTVPARPLLLNKMCGVQEGHTLDPLFKHEFILECYHLFVIAGLPLCVGLGPYILFVNYSVELHQFNSSRFLSGYAYMSFIFILI